MHTGGLFWVTDISAWFSNRAGISAAFMAFVYIDFFSPDATLAAQLEAFAAKQLNYVFGYDNPSGFSFVEGCGNPTATQVRGTHSRLSTGFNVWPLP